MTSHWNFFVQSNRIPSRNFQTKLVTRVTCGCSSKYSGRSIATQLDVSCTCDHKDGWRRSSVHGEVPHPLSFALQDDPLPLPFPTDLLRPVLQRSSRRSNGFPLVSNPTSDRIRRKLYIVCILEKASFRLCTREKEKRSCVNELTILKKIAVYITILKMYT